jgi:hypothetical protein
MAAAFSEKGWGGGCGKADAIRLVANRQSRGSQSRAERQPINSHLATNDIFAT